MKDSRVTPESRLVKDLRVTPESKLGVSATFSKEVHQHRGEFCSIIALSELSMNGSIKHGISNSNVMSASLAICQYFHFSLRLFCSLIDLIEFFLPSFHRLQIPACRTWGPQDIEEISLSFQHA